MADPQRHPTRRSSPLRAPARETWVQVHLTQVHLALRLYLTRLLQRIIQYLQRLEQHLDPRNTTDPDTLNQAETFLGRVAAGLMERWKVGLGTIRGRLPVAWQHRLSDRLLTSLVVGILALTPVLGGQLIGWLGSQLANWSHPSITPSTPSTLSPVATTPEVPDTAPALPSPPPATASPVLPPPPTVSYTAQEEAVADSGVTPSNAHTPTISPTPPTLLDTDQASQTPAILPASEVSDISPTSIYPTSPSQTADGNSTPVGEGVPSEPSLFSMIQTQLAEAIAPYGQAILLALTPDYARNRLTVQLSPDWYALEPSQQDTLAIALQQQAKELQFTTIELVNSMGSVVARSPVVGDGMVILQRHQ